MGKDISTCRGRVCLLGTTAMEPFLRLAKCAFCTLNAVSFFSAAAIFLTLCFLRIQSTLACNSLFSCFYGVGVRGRLLLMCFSHVIQLSLILPLVILTQDMNKMTASTVTPGHLLKIRMKMLSPVRPRSRLGRVCLCWEPSYPCAAPA